MVIPMSSKVEIFNMALFHAGSTDKIASESEHSQEAIVCSTFYDTCLDALLAYKSADWGFATKSIVLADVGSPPSNWAYRYSLPNDCVRAIGIVIPGTRNPAEDQQIPFDIQRGDVSATIVTDQPQAELIYISRGLPAERLPSSFVEALALRLGAQIAMPLKKDSGLRQELLQLAEAAIQVAMAASLNQQQQDNPPPSVYESEMHA